jgi:hypothetical protein
MSDGPVPINLDQSDEQPGDETIPLPKLTAPRQQSAKPHVAAVVRPKPSKPDTSPADSQQVQQYTLQVLSNRREYGAVVYLLSFGPMALLFCLTVILSQRVFQPAGWFLISAVAFVVCGIGGYYLQWAFDALICRRPARRHTHLDE